jgi:putative NADH-flavin reductase
MIETSRKKDYTNRDLMEAIINLEYKLSNDIKDVNNSLKEHIQNYDIIVLGKNTGNGLIKKTNTLSEKLEEIEKWKNNVAGRLVIVGGVVSAIVAIIIKKI